MGAMLPYSYVNTGEWTMDVTVDGNMASARVDKLWLAASGGHPITDETWREYLGHSAASVRSQGPFHGVLFWAPKYGPSGPQRKMLTDDFAEAVRLDLQRCVVVISTSALARGTMTAINWFTRSRLAAFAPEEASRALDWLAKDIEFDRTQGQRALDEIVRAVQGRDGSGARGHDGGVVHRLG
jgi:hypothetical protein